MGERVALVLNVVNRYVHTTKQREFAGKAGLYVKPENKIQGEGHKEVGNRH